MWGKRRKGPYLPEGILPVNHHRLEARVARPQTTALHEPRPTVWLKGSARALETHIVIVCEHGFTEESRGPQLLRAYISFSGHDCVK
jgi:hypothetical protein